ncbi:MAG: TlpA disulfide reductase family protein [Planctomycetota bacterium]
MTRPLDRLRSAAIALVVGAGTVALAQVQAHVQDEHLDAVLGELAADRAAFAASGGGTYDQWIAMQRDALAKIDFGGLSMHQLARLYGEALLDRPDGRRPALDRLDALRPMVREHSAEGAALAALEYGLRGAPSPEHHPDTELQSKLLGRAVRHAHLHEAMARGLTPGFVNAIEQARDPEVLRAHRDAIADLPRMVVASPPRMAVEVRSLWSLLGRLDLDAEQREAHRVMLVDYLRRSAEAAGPDGGDAIADDGERAFVRDTLAVLDGASARGTLIGHEAPEMTIEWSSDDSIASLADLRGSVVVLDFWTTWCGPCLSSFPDVQALIDHYEGLPVRVMGVTSLQGRVYNLRSDGPIDCEDDPAAEHDLMPEFMAERNMTWPVVFTRQDVFNPDFGVRGIPHVAIIDGRGIVRYNGLHPAAPMAAKTEKIDGLLREMGVEPPAGDDPDG